MSNTEIYESKIKIPSEWTNKIEQCPDIDAENLRIKQIDEFIKKYYGKKSKKDIAQVLGMHERTVFKRIRKLRNKGEMK